ncbi:MAG: hypothetical protein ACLTEZ_00160 [Ruthenibacterium lactatiformans]
MVDHKIAACTKDGIWLLGTVDDYIFEAKVCDEASGFGIDCGRVIKLHARKYCEDKKGKEIFAYERGWDKYPRGKHKGVAQALIRFCESLPEQDIWRHTFYKKVRRFLVTEDDVLEYDENGNPC